MLKWLLKKFKGICSVVLMTCLLASLSLSQASEISNTQSISTVVQNTTVGTARDWGLSETEWTHYQQLMQGPNGHWYPQLSPVAVLGLNAQTDEERVHFAEIFSKAEHDKVARELLFNHLVYLAMRKLYPTEPIIQPFDKTPFNPDHVKNIGATHE